jgi:hypothetical protein
MVEDSFVARLEAALVEPMTSAQEAFVDNRLHAAIARAGNQPPRGWRGLTTRTALLLALLVLVVLPTLFAVSATLFFPGSETPFGLAGSVEFSREIEAAKAVTPIPPGWTWPATLRVTYGDSYSRGGGYVSVEYVAICMWQLDWLDAHRSTDAPRLAADRAVILGIPGWRSYHEPFGTQSYRDVLDRVIAAVARDDPAPVRANVDLNCRGVRP